MDMKTMHEASMIERGWEYSRQDSLYRRDYPESMHGFMEITLDYDREKKSYSLKAELYLKPGIYSNYVKSPHGWYIEDLTLPAGEAAELLYRQGLHWAHDRDRV